MVLVVGSANMDLVFGTRRMPAPGETVLGLSFATHPGGKGANQAVAIGRLGGEVSFAGCVGSDAFGAELRAGLVAASVGVEHLGVWEGPSGTAGIFVDDEGRNMIVVAPGANDAVSPARVDAALGALDPDVALAQLEVPLPPVEAASRAKRFILNPAPARPLPDSLLAGCFALTPNESELRALTGIEATDEDACRAAAHRLLDRGVQNVVATLGDRGCYWASAEGERHFPAPPVAAVDTTAAGDAFNGALALFVAEGRDLANALALANCVGALSVTRRGAQASMPDRNELRRFAGDLL